MLNIKTYALFAYLASMLLIASIYIDRSLLSDHHMESRQQVSEDLEAFSKRLSSNLYKNIHLIRGLSAFIAAKPSLASETFAAAAKNLIDQQSQLRQISAAPNLVIRYLYPVQGTEAAIGLDYRTVPLQLAAVMQAKTSRQLVLTGPLRRLQGGVELISRVPVYIKNLAGEESFWGVISAVIDVERVYQDSGLVEAELPIEIAIRNSSHAGQIGEVFWGSPGLFKETNIRNTITLASASWELVARPINGWESTSKQLLLKRLVNFGVTLILFFVLFFFFKTIKKVSHPNLKFRKMFEDSPLGIAVINSFSGHIYEANPAYFHIAGRSLEELRALDWMALTHPEDVQKDLDNMAHMNTGKSSGFKMQKRYIQPDGTVRWVNMTIAAMQVEDTSKPRHLCMTEDITDIKESDFRHKTHSKVLAKIVDGAPLLEILNTLIKEIEQRNTGDLCSILQLDNSGSHLRVTAAPNLPSFYSDAVNGIKIGAEVGSCATAAFTQQRVIVEDIASDPLCSPYTTLASKANIVSCWSEPIFGLEKHLLGVFAIYHTARKTPTDNDIKTIEFAAQLASIAIEQKLAADKLHLLAHYDVLTLLPNRALLTDRFNQAVAHSKRTGSMLAICFLDLDDFKPINDHYGHAVGDKILIDVSKRIQSSIREDDTLSRQGGDEFILLLGHLSSYAQSEQAVKRILSALSKPFVIAGQSHQISASIGITLYPADNHDLDTLIRHADHAMYSAKQLGKNQQQLFSPNDNQNLIKHQEALKGIKQALAKDEFQLYYQPKVNMQTGEAFGAEALIRWIHPEKGLIPPLDFLPLIDGTDLEVQLGGWVINEAIKQLNLWNLQGITLELSINVSSHHLESSLFFGQLKNALGLYPNIKPQNLQLEVLESSVLDDVNLIGDIILKLKNEMGMLIALDDFGTGYSSLTHMRHLPANTIKIDQSFVRDMLDDPSDYAIIEGVIGLSKAFNRQVIAEGVETTEHGLMLQTLGCQLAQGYGIARPMPAKELPSWLEKYTPNEQWQQFDTSSKGDKANHSMLFKLTFAQWTQRFIQNIQSAPEDIDGWPCLEIEQCPGQLWIKHPKTEHLFEASNLSRISAAFSAGHAAAMLIYDEYQSGQIESARDKLAELERLIGEIIKLVEASAKKKQLAA